MNNHQAREILLSLVQGLDPTTGRNLPSGGTLHHADILRALLAGASSLATEIARENRRAKVPSNSRATWSSQEESTLMAAFHAGDALATIAESLGRSLRAVEMRLEKLGLITQEQRITRAKVF